MEAVGCLLVIILIPLVFGFITATIADNKGLNSVGWFFVGFFFSLLGILIVMIVKPDHTELNKRKMAAGGFKKCRFCLSIIKQQATRCPKCSGDLTVEESEPIEDVPG